MTFRISQTTAGGGPITPPPVTGSTHFPYCTDVSKTTNLTRDSVTFAKFLFFRHQPTLNIYCDNGTS